MSAVPATIFLAAALGCSFIGRVLLVKAAFQVSQAWGMAVMFVPFGPLFFRFQYRELAYPTRYWRMAVVPLMFLFFVNGGTASVQQSLPKFGRPKTMEASVNNSGFHLPVPAKVVAAAVKGLDHSDPTVDNTPGKPASADPAKSTDAALSPAPTAAGAPIAPATPAPAATPSTAVAAAAAAMAPAPKILNMAERMEANRRELDRLAVWYDSLRHERGYLRKGDTEAIVAFNNQAAQYQTALQLARTEQAELAKLTAKK